MFSRALPGLRTALIASTVCAASYAGAASAAPVTYGTVRIWDAATPGDTINSIDQQALATNPLAIAANLVYTGTFTGPASGNLNFLENSGTPTIATFLMTGAGSFSPSISGLTQTISGSNFSRATVMDFAFTLAQPVNMTITHDDGFSIDNALNTAVIVDQSKPTSADSYTFTLAAGSYNLWYEESNGLPAELNLHVNSVPEPASLAVVGVGIAGLATLRRRRTA